MMMCCVAKGLKEPRGPQTENTGPVTQRSSTGAPRLFLTVLFQEFQIRGDGPHAGNTGQHSDRHVPGGQRCQFPQDGLSLPTQNTNRIMANVFDSARQIIPSMLFF